VIKRFAVVLQKRRGGNHQQQGQGVSDYIDPKEVNSKEAKLACDAIHGQITMFNMDLAGAFTLISFNPEDMHLMGSELTEDKVIFSCVAYLDGVKRQPPSRW
jgi:hypothetical protein